MWLWTSVSISCRGPSSSHSWVWKTWWKQTKCKSGWIFFFLHMNKFYTNYLNLLYFQVLEQNCMDWYKLSLLCCCFWVMELILETLYLCVCLIFGRSGHHDQQRKWWLRLAFLRHQKWCHCVVSLFRGVPTKITIIEARPYNIIQLWRDYYSCSLCHSSWLEDIMMDPELRVWWCCHSHVDSRKVFPKGVMRKIF